ncbi:penicillin-binding protein 1B [Methylophaga sp.]|uniref:penicillin-binding protein 1B n=1 Tax=Methylophaga sp. TaxID=2024840 RepID=UPI0027223F09|nr:penicillin-binding protein 1B [Methylophaga sp.]MDO8826710.1 penicillin-binding protein 1B [Methylophaga sp.]
MTKHKPSKTKKSKSVFRRLISAKVIISLLVLITVASAIAIATLDFRVRSEFEGKRWALPAKVYARPLELYTGAPLSLNDLKIELRALGYQFVDKANLPGQVAFSASSATLSTRGFHFPDEHEPARELILDFSGDTLSQMRSADQQALTLIRLEPALIGGIYPLNNEDRDLIQLQDAPQAFIDALIAIEDRDFYDHFGISPKGMARATLANIRAGAFVQGGSTLTQQLIKNFYLTADRTLMRKMLEVPMAMILEWHYSKEEILEAYLNEVYLGQSGNRAIHGFGLGAAHYFAQPIQELKLHQLALLAGLVRGPSYYDPRRNPERAKQRRNLVLSVLHQQGSISDEEYMLASTAELEVVAAGSSMKEAYPAYIDLVKRQLRREYKDEDLGSEGLQIFTSLDPISQHKAEASLISTIDDLSKTHGERLAKLQGSMVVTDPQTGEVLALIGDRNTRFHGFNRALDAMRPIGSLVKPAVYLTALEQGYTLISELNDSPFSLTLPNQQAWTPKNFDGKSYGLVPLHAALTHSYNLSTAQLGMEIGVDKVIDTLQRLGVERRMDAYPSLLLGAQSLSTLEVAAMYQTIAATGFQIPPRTIRTVTDSAGEALSSYPFQLQQTIDEKAMYLLQYNLQQVTRSGTARSIYQQLPMNINSAGKTGTSDQQRDSWFAGFTGNRLAVVWLGLDDNSPMPITGSSGALRAWTKFIAQEPLQSFEPAIPEGIVMLWIDPLSGKLADGLCENATQIPFIAGTQPTETAACAMPEETFTENPIKRSIDWVKDIFR